MNTLTQKVCRRCELPKPADTAHFRAEPSNTKTGLHSYCRDCEAERSRERGKDPEHRKKQVAGMTRRRKQQREKLLIRHCLQCHKALELRGGESWTQFKIRSLCGSTACLKRHILQLALVSDRQRVQEAQEAYRAKQEAAKAERIRQARAWSDEDNKQVIAWELKRRQEYQQAQGAGK